MAAKQLNRWVSVCICEQSSSVGWSHQHHDVVVRTPGQWACDDVRLVHE